MIKFTRHRGIAKAIQLEKMNFNSEVFEGKRHGVQPQNGITGFSLHFSKRTQLWENSFKPKVAIAKLVWKMQKKRYGIMKSGLDAMHLFLLDDLLRISKKIKNSPCKSQWGPFKTSLHHLGYNQIRWGTSNDSGTCKIFFEKTLGTIQLLKAVKLFFHIVHFSVLKKSIILKLLVGLCLLMSVRLWNFKDGGS